MDDLHIVLLVIIGFLTFILICNLIKADEIDNYENINDNRLKRKMKINPRARVQIQGCGCGRDRGNKLLEHYEHFNDNGFEPDFAWLARNNLLPWWNSTRHTRNTSWDIRGDVPIPYYDTGPWWNSPLI
jgi:hypothetical protein